MIDISDTSISLLSILHEYELPVIKSFQDFQNRKSNS